MTRHVAGQEAEIERGERRAEAGDIGLALDADVEQAGVEADRDREAGEDEARRVIEREADAFEIAERAARSAACTASIGFSPIASTTRPEMKERGGDVEQRDQRDVGPGGKRL